jgi:L-asparaginase
VSPIYSLVLTTTKGDTVTNQTGRPRVTVFSLGGTIASTNAGASSSGVTPQLSGLDLIGAVPQLRNIAEVTAVEFRQVPSGDLTISDIVALAHAIDTSFEEGAEGVVVTQGTDTIEETSFALDLLVHSSRPVVVTGAMRNPTMASADGPANLLGAIRVAVSQDAIGLGTLVVLNDEIHAARFVRKTHTANLGTFRSPSSGPLGWIVEDRLRIVSRVAPLAGFEHVAAQTVPAVALIKCSLGDDARVIDQLESLGYTGAVVEGFGGGHVPARVVSALENLAARMPVVLASRTGSGELLQETYGFIGSERDLLSRRGLISSGALDGLKARILLSLAMSVDEDPTRARRAFESAVASISSFEIPPYT